MVDEKICEATGWTGLAAPSGNAFAAGMLVFTPRDLGARGVMRGDRPHASLLFVSAGRRYAASDSTVAYDTSLTIGVLGLAAAADVQRVLHDVTESVQPKGWSDQISDGGEPTARYSLARQALLAGFGSGSSRGNGQGQGRLEPIAAQCPL